MYGIAALRTLIRFAALPDSTDTASRDPDLATDGNTKSYQITLIYEANVFKISGFAFPHRALRNAG